ncbi:hypothetical protein QNM99_20445 [Pseudomonas sp. PCH446]
MLIGALGRSVSSRSWRCHHGNALATEFIPGATTPSTKPATVAQAARLSLSLLIAFVVGSIIGSGAYSLPRTWRPVPVPARS